MATENPALLYIEKEKIEQTDWRHLWTETRCELVLFFFSKRDSSSCRGPDPVGDKYLLYITAQINFLQHGTNLLLRPRDCLLLKGTSEHGQELWAHDSSPWEGDSSTLLEAWAAFQRHLAVRALPISCVRVFSVIGLPTDRGSSVCLDCLFFGVDIIAAFLAVPEPPPDQ